MERLRRRFDVDTVLVCDVQLVVFHTVNTEPTSDTESLCVGWQYLVWELFRQEYQQSTTLWWNSGDVIVF